VTRRPRLVARDGTRNTRHGTRGNSKLDIVYNRLKVAVLMGGISTERDISIQSGQCVAEALKEAGFDVVTADIRPDNLDILEDSSVNVFFIALHGEFGEDGQLQQILEDRSLLYTGSGPKASKLAFDKLTSKDFFSKAGVTTPKVIKFDTRMEEEELARQLAQLSERFVVKPVRQGSTIGVAIVDGPKSALAAARKCSDKFGDCMIEEFIGGREITVGILQSRPLPIIEIRSKTGFYDYHAKYIDEETEFLFDTIDDPALTAKVQTAALDCFRALGCRHFARVDFILGDDRNPYALEINTIPGLTAHSLLPKAAAKTGLSMSDLCAKIVEAAYSSVAKREARYAQSP
jgi:D-alanine-D-alanine ligase